MTNNSKENLKKAITDLLSVAMTTTREESEKILLSVLLILDALVEEQIFPKEMEDAVERILMKNESLH